MSANIGELEEELERLRRIPTPRSPDGEAIAARLDRIAELLERPKRLTFEREQYTGKIISATIEHV